MKKRQVIIVGSILLVVGAVILNKRMSKKPSERANRTLNKDEAPTVNVTKVQPKSIENTIDINGKVRAKDRTELFAEINGLVLPGQAFRKGTSFVKGQLMLNIDSKDQELALISQRNDFFNKLTSLMPDHQSMFPENNSVWKNYLLSFDTQKAINDLPATKTDKERFFISSNQVFTQYYNIKSQEKRLSKYQIYAPFSGILAKANIQNGSLVRAGQNLGELIGKNHYELETAVSIYQLEEIKTNQEVRLYAPAIKKKLKGRIKQISNQVDESSQMVWFTIEVQDKHLLDGMFLEGSIKTKSIENAMVVDRSLLLSDDELFVVENKHLRKVKVQVVDVKDNQVIVTGLKPGALLLDDSSPSFYEGKKVITAIKK